MNVQFRGPEGIRARMAEIQAKMQAISGPSPDSTSEPIPSALAGTISSSGTTPMNPFSGGIGIHSMQTPGDLQPLIAKAATEAGVDPILFDALVATESAYDPNARSSAGAMGLSQLMPETAKGLGVNNPFDPSENLRGGARYLAQMLERFGGDTKLALAAYNAGPGAVERFNGIPPYRQTQQYVEKIHALMEARKAR